MEIKAMLKDEQKNQFGDKNFEICNTENTLVLRLPFSVTWYSVFFIVVLTFVILFSVGTVHTIIYKPESVLTICFIDLLLLFVPILFLVVYLNKHKFLLICEKSGFKIVLPNKEIIIPAEKIKTSELFLNVKVQGYKEVISLHFICISASEIDEEYFAKKVYWKSRNEWGVYIKDTETFALCFKNTDEAENVYSKISSIINPFLQKNE